MRHREALSFLYALKQSAQSARRSTNQIAWIYKIKTKTVFPLFTQFEFWKQIRDQQKILRRTVFLKFLLLMLVMSKLHRSVLYVVFWRIGAKKINHLKFYIFLIHGDGEIASSVLLELIPT